MPQRDCPKCEEMRRDLKASDARLLEIIGERSNLAKWLRANGWVKLVDGIEQLFPLASSPDVETAPTFTAAQGVSSNKCSAKRVRHEECRGVSGHTGDHDWPLQVKPVEVKPVEPLPPTPKDFPSDLKELKKEIASLGRSKLEELLIYAIKRFQAAEAPKPPEHTCKGLNAVFYSETCPGCIAQNKGKAVLARSCLTPGCNNPALIVRYSCIACHEASLHKAEDTGGHIAALPGYDPSTRSTVILPAKRCPEMLGVIQCALAIGHEGRHSLPALTWTSPNDHLSKKVDMPAAVSLPVEIKSPPEVQQRVAENVKRVMAQKCVITGKDHRWSAEVIKNQTDPGIHYCVDCKDKRPAR